MTNVYYASVARISDLDGCPYDIVPVASQGWATGDYVKGVVTGEPSELYRIENSSGDMIPVHRGDVVVGAFGERAATLEGVGSWRAMQDGKMHAMTSAGLFGAFTSVSALLARPLSLDYLGHVMRDGRKVTMRDFAIGNSDSGFSIPTILLVGTSMSAGKSAAGRLVVQELSGIGLDVIGCKLTGAGRLRDVLSFKRCGASKVFDFVDVGLPSTMLPENEFRAAIRPLLATINGLKPDFLVAEAGASPMEPYNGAAAIDELGDNICCTILCASDPYAVVGVQQAFGLQPDLVTGPATDTSAGVDLIRKLTGVEAINILRKSSIPAFREFLTRVLNVSFD
jgi:hypothetical protein